MNFFPERKNSAPPGFRVPPKPKFNPVNMSRRELQDHYNRNNHILATTSPNSQASYVPRLQAEQSAIEQRINELNQQDLEHDLQILSVGTSTAHLKAPAIRTKQRILASIAQPKLPAPTERLNSTHQFPPAIAPMGLAEAVSLEQKAHIEDLERQQKDLERRQRRGEILPGEVLSQKEKDARLKTFMSYKPTDSDLEYDDDEDEEGDDWWLDDVETGRKGQDITDPDIPDDMDISDIIRVDHERIDSY